MKKKILMIFMAIATTLCCALGLAACGGEDGTGSGSGGEEEIDIQPPHAPSEGLEYQWVEEELPHFTAGYAVMGMGTCTDTDLVIPSTHDGLPVVAVVNLGNYDGEKWVCPDITSVYIPNSITCLEYVALNQYTSLESISVARGNTKYHSKGNCIIETESKTLITGCKNSVIPDSVTSIGNGAFWGCTSLTGITIPNSVTSIGSYAFHKCSSLSSVTIGNGVTSIGNSAFHDCSSLTSITIPDSVTSIGRDAFYGCTSLTSFTIPDSVTKIEPYAFYRCSSLTSITIPNSVTSIGYDAFSGCTSLSSITIPDSVTEIGNWTFKGCSSLESITIPNSVTSIGYDAFNGCTSLSLIDFKGTKAKWKVINKGYFDETGDYTVQCTDGKLDKEGNEIE